MLLILPFLMSLSCFSQNKIINDPKAKKGNIQGIGMFLIDKTTTSIIDSLAKSSYAKVEETNNHLGNITDPVNQINVLNKIFELKRDTVANGYADSHAMFQNNVRVFYLNYLNIAGIDINNIYLKFYKDTLIEFSCEPSNLHSSELSIVDAFVSKYGPPGTILTSEKAIVCQNGYGATFNYKNVEISKFWSSIKGRISAAQFIKLIYDDCKPIDYDIFSVSDDIIKDKLNAIEERLLAAPSELKRKKALEKLKDL